MWKGRDLEPGQRPPVLCTGFCTPTSCPGLYHWVCLYMTSPGCLQGHFHLPWHSDLIDHFSLSPMAIYRDEAIISPTDYAIPQCSIFTTRYIILLLISDLFPHVISTLSLSSPLPVLPLTPRPPHPIRSFHHSEFQDNIIVTCIYVTEHNGHMQVIYKVLTPNIKHPYELICLSQSTLYIWSSKG